MEFTIKDILIIFTIVFLFLFFLLHNREDDIIYKDSLLTNKKYEYQEESIFF
jgi:hypothetical protein